jgi:23S rRNA (cytidine1920-2'-O)/16S rRNA (cytidine1409-2'-O)-methyltransferase
MRLDRAIFLRGLAQSRSRAALLISDNCVSVDGRIINKASFEVDETSNISVIDSISYVGRGGLKLEYALKTFAIDVEGKSAVDIGASTGGFTQCLLRYGATSVAAVDVGHGQLHPDLLNDKRILLLENTNAKFLTSEMIGGKKDIAVSDVSFISQTEIHNAMFSCLNENGIAITLIKPQFEAGAKYLNKKGVIKDKKVFLNVFERIENSANANSFEISGMCISPILGGDGNIEFLALFKKGSKRFDFMPIYNSVLKGD